MPLAARVIRPARVRVKAGLLRDRSPAGDSRERGVPHRSWPPADLPPEARYRQRRHGSEAAITAYPPTRWSVDSLIGLTVRFRDTSIGG